VFVTAFEHYAPDAFEVEAVDYLLKPVRFDRLRQALERARRRRAMRSAEQRLAQTQAPAPIAESCHEDAIWVDLPRGRVRVAVEDIEWIEAAKDYVLLHTAARSYIHRITMAALEEKIDPQALMRVHRSAFVRPSLVREIERLGKGLIALVMEGGVTVPVGPSYSKAVLERLRLA
jgi:two-component system response regulator AlgR